MQFLQEIFQHPQARVLHILTSLLSTLSTSKALSQTAMDTTKSTTPQEKGPSEAPKQPEPSKTSESSGSQKLDVVPKGKKGDRNDYNLKRYLDGNDDSWSSEKAAKQ